MDALAITLINPNFLTFLKSANNRKKGRGASTNSFKSGAVDWITSPVIFDMAMDVAFAKGISVDVEIFSKNALVTEPFKLVRGVSDVSVSFFPGRTPNKEEFVKSVPMDLFVGLIIVLGTSPK